MSVTRGADSKGSVLPIVAVLAAFLVLALVVGVCQAATKAYHYQSVDVDISILGNSDLLITEKLAFAFTSGDFHYGYRSIPTDRLESIEDVEVWEGDRKYELNPEVRHWIDIRREKGGSPGGDNYAYATWRHGDQFWVAWWFPRTENATRTIALRYRVRGALRIYATADQLYWKPIFADRDTYISFSRVTVHLPTPVPTDQLVISTYGVPAAKKMMDGSTIAFVTGRLEPAEGLEISISFPHGIVSGVPPSWQARLEKKEAYDARVKPVVNLALTLFGLILVPLVGAMWIRRAFARRGSLPRVEVPAHQYSPPSELSPGLVGLLVYGHVRPADMVATIFHLAHRGVLQIVQTEKRRWFGTEKDLLIVKGKHGAKFPFERLLVETLASPEGELFSRQSRHLRQLLQEFSEKLEQEAVRQGLFEEEPSKSIRRLRVPGIILSFLAVFFGVPTFLFLGRYAEMVFVPFAALLLIGVAALLLATGLTRRTETGAVEAAQWKAFGKYLKKMVKDRQLSADSLDHWDSYFCYAVVFGISRGWVKRFSSLEAPAPGWFYVGSYNSDGVTIGNINISPSPPSLSSISSAFNSMVGMVQSSFSGGGRGTGSRGGGGAG